MMATPIDRRWGCVAALFGLLSVAAGAFGAHALEDRLGSESLAHWELAARYLAIHSLALLGTAMLLPGREGRGLQFAPWGFGLGMLLFSGSLFAYALTGLKVFAMTTPLGGLSLVVAWACLAWGLFRS